MTERDSWSVPDAAYIAKHSDAITSGVVVADASGTIVQCNRAATEIMRLPTDQIVGKSLTQTDWWPEQPFLEDGSPVEGFTRPWLAALRAGRPVTPQVIGAFADGQPEPVWLLLSAQPLPSASRGQPSGLVLTITDITLQKRAESLYAQAADELHAVLHALPDLYLRLDAEGTIIDYSIGAGFDAYMSSDDLIGRRLDELLPADVARRGRKAIAVAKLSGEVQTVEVEVQTKRAGSADFEARCGRLPDGGAIVLIRDVTEQRVAQRELARSERLYRGAFERAGVGMFTYDRSLRVTGCNDAFLRLTGLAREYFVGLDLASLSEGRILPCLRAALESGGGSYDGPYVPTGQGFGGVIRLYTQPTTDADGSVSGGLAVLGSMTDRFAAGTQPLPEDPKGGGAADESSGSAAS